jgi:hypothetical protein
VKVDLYSEPDVSSLAIGDAANLTLLRRAFTDSAGCYQIPQPDASTWLAAADSVGRVDLTLVVYRPNTQLEMRYMPVTLTTTTVGTDVTLVVAPTNSVDVSDDLGDVDTSAPVTGDVSQSFNGVATSGTADFTSTDTYGATTSPNVVSKLAPNPVAQRACQGGLRWVKRDDYGKRSTVVGQFWSSTPDVTQTWTYSRGASSELGAAWSTSGTAGSFSASKSWTKTTDASVTFPTAVGKVGNYYRTLFKYGKFDQQQYDYCSSQWYYVGTEVRRTSWEGGATVTTGLSVPQTDAGNCSRYDSGSMYDTSISRARTWSDGVTLAAVMKTLLASVTLSSTTGFTAAARNHIHFTADGRVCGVYGPLSHPGFLVARQRVNP